MQYTAADLNLEGYEDKFKYVQDNLKSKDIKVMQKIINDPTMFCYRFLQLDGKPLRLYHYQDKIICA